jgi:hypothetical protein
LTDAGSCVEPTYESDAFFALRFGTQGFVSKSKSAIDLVCVLLPGKHKGELKDGQGSFVRSGSNETTKNCPNATRRLRFQDNLDAAVFFLRKDLISLGRHNRYYALSDDLDQPVNLETARKFEGLVWDLLAFTADKEKIPEWKPGSFFKRFAQH